MRVHDLNESLEDLRNRLASIRALIDPKSGATDGERAAARAAYDRVLARIRSEHGDVAASTASKTPSSHERTGPRAQRPAQRPEPQRSRYRIEIGDFEEAYVFWKRDPNEGKRGSNKVWGYARKRGSGVTSPVTVFWGGFGKTLSSHEKPYHVARELALQKENKGYRRVPADDIDYVNFRWLLSQLDRL